MIVIWTIYTYIICVCVYVYTHETYQFVNDSDWDAFRTLGNLSFVPNPADSTFFSWSISAWNVRTDRQFSMARPVQGIKTSLQMRLERSLNGQDLGGSWGDLWSMNEYEYYCYINALYE